jgi:general secretion pathway protein L
MNLVLIENIDRPAKALHEDGSIESLSNEMLQKQDSCVTLLVGGECNVVNTPMPIKQVRQIIKALPFALEEQLANDVENNHLHLIGRDNGKAYALTLQHSIMKGIVEKHSPSKLYFLPLLLPVVDGTASALIIDGCACVRINELTAFSVPMDLLPLTIEKYLADDDALKGVQLCYADEPAELLELQLENMGLVVSQTPFTELQKHIRTQTLINSNNLLTGEYQVKVSTENKAHFKFKPVVSVAACLLIVILGINMVSASQQNNLAGMVKNASKEFYLKLFPGERIRGIKRQFSEKLDSSSSSSSGEAYFTGILAKTAGEIRKSKTAQIHSVRFTAKKGVLEISVLTDNVAQLDGIKKKLEQKSLTVEIASANNDGKKIKGLLKVSQNG